MTVCASQDWSGDNPATRQKEVRWGKKLRGKESFENGKDSVILWSLRREGRWWGLYRCERVRREGQWGDEVRGWGWGERMRWEAKARGWGEKVRWEAEARGWSETVRWGGEVLVSVERVSERGWGERVRWESEARGWGWGERLRQEDEARGWSERLDEVRGWDVRDQNEGVGRVGEFWWVKDEEWTLSEIFWIGQIWLKESWGMRN